MVKKLIPTIALAATTLVGGAIGASLLGTANAASPSPSVGTATTGATTTAPSGKWHSNTDPTHEAGESAARKAAEIQSDATGIAPSGTGGG
jgi:hypothetical protein